MTEKKQAILQATLELVAERGLHNTPTSSIATQAAVAEGTIFRHFSTKEKLLEEVFLWRLGALRNAVVVGLIEDVKLRDKFFHMAENLLEFYLGDPASYYFIENYLGSSLGRNFRHDLLFSQEVPDNAPLLDLLYEGASSGELKSLPRFAYSALVFGPIYFFFEEIFCQQQSADRELFQQILSCCWDAVAIQGT